MGNEVEHKKRALRRKVDHFLTSELYGRHEISSFIQQISEAGEVAIFGGMLRDLALVGNKKFSSDVDLVIDTTEISRLEKILFRYKPKRNAFGGYRIALQKWMVDIWPLSRTWAFYNGYLQGSKLFDLTNTTFFNWDAIVYELNSGLVHCSSNYFQELTSRLLKINFAENPNPEGVTIRALRLLAIREARLSYELAQYVADVIDTVGKEKLWALEQEKHKPARVTLSVMNEFLEQFHRIKSESRDDPVSIPNKQMMLGFIGLEADHRKEERTCRPKRQKSKFRHKKISNRHLQW